MAFVNFATREITAKVVYYGPALGGKTTSLQYIHNSLSPDNRGKMISLATEEDRTIYFDFLPLSLGKIQDFAVRIQLYTVPGQVRYNATRKLVLRGVDGVVFVADSQKHKKLANLESFNNMEENLKELGKDLQDIPHSLQFNKIDLPGVLRAEDLNQLLNKMNVPFFETSAISGIGVLDALKSITKLVFNDLSKKALLQKKAKTTSIAGSFSTGSALVAKPQTVPMPASEARSKPAGPVRDYYGDDLNYPEPARENSETVYPDFHETYGESASTNSSKESSHSATEYEDNIEEVEPVREPSQASKMWEEEDSLADTHTGSQSSYPPESEESNELEELAAPVDLQVSFSYSKLFQDSTRDLPMYIDRLEKQIWTEEYSKAILTAREIFARLLSEVFPPEYLLDTTEASKILALNMKFKRYLRFKHLLNSDHLDGHDLLFLHHFLCDLYISLKEF
jgi:signal recognition particle receptor subunit beta